MVVSALLICFYRGGSRECHSQRYDSATGAGKASIWQTNARRNVTIRRNKHLGSNQAQLNHTDQLQLFTRCIKCTSIYRWYHINNKCASRRPYLNDSWPINHLLIIFNLRVHTYLVPTNHAVFRPFWQLFILKSWREPKTHGALKPFSENPRDWSTGKGQMEAMVHSMHVEHGTQPRCKGCKGMIWIDRAPCANTGPTYFTSQVWWNSAKEVTEMSMDNIVNIAKQKAAGEIPALSTPAVRGIMQHQLGNRVSINNYIYKPSCLVFLKVTPTLWDHRKPIKESRNRKMTIFRTNNHVLRLQ